MRVADDTNITALTQKKLNVYQKPNNSSPSNIFRIFSLFSSYFQKYGSKGKGIQFIVLYPPKCSHDLPSLAGLYTILTSTIFFRNYLKKKCLSGAKQQFPSNIS